MREYYFDIEQLAPDNHTGISSVVAGLAEQMLLDTEIEWKFSWGSLIMPRHLVRLMVEGRSGSFIQWRLGHTDTPGVVPLFEPHLRAQGSVGLYAGPKRRPGLFPFEAQIIYDLTTLLFPEFHTPQKREFYNKTLMADVGSNDLNICISKCTRADLLLYTGVEESKTVVAYPGYGPIIEDGPIIGGDPYVIVLGTLEPRKNVSLVLEFLASRPAILNRFRFLFVGAPGWGTSFHDLVQSYGLNEAAADKRIISTGYVDNATKWTLLRSAALSIYPSLYEGFGLPVLEALAAGCPVVASCSSSLPEVGGDVVDYFNPTSVESLEGAFGRAVSSIYSGQTESRLAAYREWASQFSWNRFYKEIKSSITTLPIATSEKKLPVGVTR